MLRTVGTTLSATRCVTSCTGVPFPHGCIGWRSTSCWRVSAKVPTTRIDRSDFRPGRCNRFAPRSVNDGAPDSLLEGSLDRIDRQRCIERLLVGYRTIFVLHDIHGYVQKKIAGVFGRSEGVSKSQLHKARTRLREFFHEFQREKFRDERMAAVKVRSRSSEALLFLAPHQAERRQAWLM